MHQSTLSAVIGVTLGLGACASNAPPIVGLYKTSVCEGASGGRSACGEPNAIVAVASNEPASDAGSSSTPSFADRGQAEYIKALADRRMSKDAKALRANLSAPVKPKAAQLDHRHITRNLTVTTSKVGAFNPDDRLQQTEVFITLAKGAGAITTWDNATSIYNVINAGTLQVASTQGGQTNLSLGTPATAPVAASIGQQFSYSTTSTQSANGTTQAENLTVTVEDAGRTLRVFRQGGPGVDLTGNVAVKVGFALPGSDKLILYQLSGLFDDDGKAANPTKLNPTRSLLDVGPSRPLMASVQMRYVIRHVTGGGGSLAPGTQDVVYHQQTTAPVDVTLVPLENAYPATFGLFTVDGSEPLAIRMGGLTPESFCFASYEEAEALQRYLASAPLTARIGRASVGWSIIDEWHDLAAADRTRLEVRSDCETSAGH